MRKQMYERAILSITEGHDFRSKVNERCGNNKKIKETVKQEMIQEIEIEGGYSKPTYKDILLYKIGVFPYNLFNKVCSTCRWVYKYTIRR